MLSCNKIFAILIVITMAVSCAPVGRSFTGDSDLNATLFEKIPAISGDSSRIDSVEMYRAVFIERLVDQNNVLEFSLLNQASELPYQTDVQGYGSQQYLYLLRIFSNGEGKHWVYFSVKFNPSPDKPSGKICVGFGPAYYGIAATTKCNIEFIKELKTKPVDSSYMLQEKSAASLIFIADSLPATMPIKKLNIEKIIQQQLNKVGGNKPLTFNVTDVFHDPAAMRFLYRKTIKF